MSRRHNILGAEELALFRADPAREQVLGITEYVVCRECGERGTVIKHLHRHGLNKEEYRAKWSGAPTASEAERNLRKKAGNRRWAVPGRRENQSQMMESVWANLSEPERNEWINNSAAALRTDEVRERISEGTKAGLAKPGVVAKLSKASKRAWKGNKARRLQAKMTATAVFSDPEVIERRQLGHAKPETRDKISQAGVVTWEGNEERREATRKMMLARWAKLKTPHGRPPEIALARRVYELRLAHVKWDDIPEIIAKETGEHRTVGAYKKLLRRHHPRRSHRQK